MLHSVRSLRGMVTSPHHLASQAGLDVLKDGGSAAQAAVAVAACLAVVYPHMTSIGGDSFWLISEPDGDVWAIDACGRAAGNASLDRYAGRGEIPRRGPLAANTVAGTISGWAALLGTDAAHRDLRARLLRDAIAHARSGVVLTEVGAEILSSKSGELASQPGDYARIFEPAGRPLRVGEAFVQPALAVTLERLASDGFGDFYKGALARDMAADLADLGSPLSFADLAAHGAERVDPLCLRLRDARLFNLPPPTQGLASLLILALFDRMQAGLPDSFEHVHALVEATKQAFLIRDREVGDPAHMQLDYRALLADRGALDRMAASIDPSRALPWPAPVGGGDTTWFAAADERGQVVSGIQSIFFEFGSGLVLPRTGVIWQNRGSSFRLADRGWNCLHPGRKPFHTLNPALAHFDDGRVMAYGTMGGEGQPQTQAAIFSRYARFGVPLQQAITAPRWLLGRAWGDVSTTLKLEDRFAPDLYRRLAEAGHDVELVKGFSSQMGHAGAIVRHPQGWLEGASDPRSDGSAAGW
ncbi:gamma-glutamyltransferase family protein [Rhizorhabdus wittichii]|uniref:gamma-glutamyltransferase family protein n=1 Tax=Rhizorhabdus wittichii TaxID=160791 RepID=UPI00037980B2|nr:gamma-glutamyltransferase family protein [Rhizorhabdus wittichii]